MLGKKAILIGIVLLLTGCIFRAPRAVLSEEARKTTRLVALLPVENKSADKLAPVMFREKILEELYYKGYPKIPIDLVDMQLMKLGSAGSDGKSGNASPQVLGAYLKVDALLYCTLSESKTSHYLFYAPTSVSASCELRSAKTGEIVWQSSSGVVEYNFGYSRYDVGRKVAQTYEAVIQEVVNKVMETLPDGPDLSG